MDFLGLYIHTFHPTPHLSFPEDQPTAHIHDQVSLTEMCVIEVNMQMMYFCDCSMHTN